MSVIAGFVPPPPYPPPLARRVGWGQSSCPMIGIAGTILVMTKREPPRGFPCYDAATPLADGSRRRKGESIESRGQPPQDGNGSGVGK